MPFLVKLTRRTSYSGEQGFSGYRKYKKEICIDCQHRCVYCNLHANYLGGYDGMELDHFRPKALSLFPQLKNDPFNLVLACRSCNGKKSDDWPAGTSAETHVNGAGYVDPFDEREEYFELRQDGLLTAKKPPARYTIDQLALNRPLAVAIRNKLLTLLKLKSASEALKQKVLAACDNGETDKAKEFVRLMDDINTLIVEMAMPTGPAM